MIAVTLRLGIAPFLAIPLLLLNACAAQDFRGSLAGTVKDSAGAGIAGAKIVVQLAGSSMDRGTITDRAGEFRVDGLPPGDYRVTVSAKGLADATSIVSVLVDSVRQIDVTLLPILKETVNVRGELSSITAQPMQVTSTVEGGVITSRDLDTIPLANRSFANIAYLAPGTEPV
ncbi:MAG TPA: carboxypeptidase-like regulatory domain-containing protein, partial [Bryobacteraceae bacterium]|nr:carboxypeptidase-like regulatory domain-containing protein [Bryobacteraceae bacterium]